MFSAVLLLLLFNPLLAAVIVVSNGAGVRISIQKRTSLTKADGTFDYEEAIRQTERTVQKHSQNVRNYERNTGLAFPRAPRDADEVHSKRQSEPLTQQQEGGAIWGGPITIGIPGQGFTIDFDTGSSDLWVLSSACVSKDKYDPETSATSKARNASFQISYGDGSSVWTHYSDSVSVAGVTFRDQYFSAVTEISSQLALDPVDGILGLALKELSNLKRAPFVQHASEQGALGRAEFSFKLTESNSSLFLGGTDTSLYNEPIERHPLSVMNGFWQIGPAVALVNDLHTVGTFDTIIDSGTTIMYGPPAEVAGFYASVPYAMPLDLYGRFWAYPCHMPPSVAFVWGLTKWKLTTDSFSLGFSPRNASMGMGAFVDQDLAMGRGVWLLGDRFLTNVYTVFSFENNSVGFASLAYMTHSS